MFHRIILEDWHIWLPMISFGTAFAIFVVLTIRTLLMKRKKIDHLANLPLEDQPPKSPSRHE